MRSQKFLILFLILTFLLTGQMLGCGDTAQSPAEPSSGISGLPPLEGVWQYQSGTFYFGLSTAMLPQILNFNANGTGAFHLLHSATRVLACAETLFSDLGNGQMAIDMTPLMGFGQGGGSMLQLYLYQFTNPNTLVLTDANGNQVTFARVNSIPSEYQCKTFTQGNVFSNLSVRPDDGSGLAYDGSNLYFKDEASDNIYPINPNNGSLGTPIDMNFSSGAYVHAMQGNDFWTLCHCGNNEEAYRIPKAAPAVTLDTVDTSSVNINEEISIDAATYDQAAAVLWLHGRDDDGIEKFLKVNSGVEPDVLSGAPVDFDLRFESMAWDGSNFWALTRIAFPQVIVKIDGNTLQTLATYKTPNEMVDWRGIAAVGSNIYLIGEDMISNEGILQQLTP